MNDTMMNYKMSSQSRAASSTEATSASKSVDLGLLLRKLAFARSVMEIDLSSCRKES